MSGFDEEIVSAAAFRTALRRFLARTDAVAAADGLSAQRYNLLLMLKAAEVAGTTATVGSLTRELELGQTAVSQLVARAEDAGLLERSRSAEDGRRSELRLTAEGERRLMSAFLALRDDRATLARALREAERQFRAMVAPQ